MLAGLAGIFCLTVRKNAGCVLAEPCDQVGSLAASHAIAAIQAFITGAASNRYMSTNIA
jgi:hypothetical protein